MLREKRGGLWRESSSKLRAMLSVVIDQAVYSFKPVDGSMQPSLRARCETRLVLVDRRCSWSMQNILSAHDDPFHPFLLLRCVISCRVSMPVE